MNTTTTTTHRRNSKKAFRPMQPTTAQATPAHQPSSTEAAALDIPTRSLKTNIGILGAWLGNPALRRDLSRNDVALMVQRLRVLKAELHRRGDMAKARQLELKKFSAGSTAH